MCRKVKNSVIVIEFITILLVFLIANIVKEDEKISIVERRKLATKPEITISNIFNGKISDGYEKYVTDQFVGRNIFREIKYWFSMHVLKQKDSNKLFVKNSEIYKMEYPLKEEAVQKSAQKINKVYEKYLKGMKVYYSIIPDKNYYLQDNHLKMDYSKIEEIMENELQNMEYIDIKNYINSESFYKTDLHWKQEKISKVADALQEKMGGKSNNIDYKQNEAGKFYGVYYGQVAANIEADVIKYLTNNIIDNCITYNYETQKEGKIYDLEKFNKSSDKYDIYLSGATPIISIENSNSQEERELLLFRDSFGSSIAPFFTENYKKITLIDIRYINSSILGEYINFENQDVLFLYSGTVLNQNILK